MQSRLEDVDVVTHVMSFRRQTDYAARSREGIQKLADARAARKQGTLLPLPQYPSSEVSQLEKTYAHMTNEKAHFTRNLTPP